MKIKILHLYPDLLNLYGDKGNIECMRSRLVWRGIDAEVVAYTCEDTGFDLSDIDIVFIGGGSDREQKIVCSRLLEHKDALKSYVEDGGSLVAVCGGYQLLGKYYKLQDETIEGLDILDIYTEQGKKRLIGNIVLETDFIDEKIVGFENHGGRTYIGEHTPLGRVAYGYGNDEKSGAEGVIYKNVVATYLHGPLLPKNPALCDYILTNALKRKNPGFEGLSPLDDDLEKTANEYIVNRFKK
ncbi:MAG: glutamine amidotransferase [Oscillospiraceae bacterium]|nr:glutamine amidotransferase [Oscillospiraceae bacterium]